MAQKTISILAIGTELTSGQIINRNASWISKRMAELGVQTRGHWTIPDDRPLIRKMLDLSAETSEIIFLTGGLGPTSDDFTREVVAKWAGLELKWDEATWTWIQNRLNERGIRPKEIQKQQCYYPEGSVILTNSQGTAHGFRLRAKGRDLIVLPGPPREIEAIWQDHLKAWLPSQFPDLDPWLTKSWDTIGFPESTVAEMTEEALTGCDFERGYRVHLPYIEVKVSFPKSRETEATGWLAKVDEALGPITALKNGAEASELLWEACRDFDQIVISDQLSGGYLWSRLSARGGSLWSSKKIRFENFSNAPDRDRKTLYLQLEPVGTREAKVSLVYQGMSRSDLLGSSPYRSALLLDREKQYFTELALLFWARELSPCREG